MKYIATDVNDTPDRMLAMVEAQRKKAGFAIDQYFYRSHLTYEKELDAIFFKSWLYAGHISQIPNNGDYFLYDVGEDSIIINRDHNGQVSASFNICRHRGARVCEQPEGNCKTFVCPYHGWVYNTDGSLKAARHMDIGEGFDDANYGLKKPQLEVFHGLIFVNCNQDAATFTPDMEKVAPALAAYDLNNAKVAHQQTYTVDANWKLALENYLECYHCATSHRAYAALHTLKDLHCNVQSVNDAMLARAEEITGIPGITTDVYHVYTKEPHFGGGAYTSRYALYEGYKTGSENGQPVAPLMGDIKDYDGGAGDFQFGPLTFMLNYPDHCVLYRFTPRGLTETDMTIVWFVRADAEEGVDYSKDAVTWLWHNTTLEDEFIIRRNSEGVNSRFFEPGPYNPEFEALCMDFIEWYLLAIDQNAAGNKA
ncbi:MAG: aromatic ring-hydroxylating oxygenase subunit alpha [Pseudomonadales bacterium]